MPLKKCTLKRLSLYLRSSRRKKVTLQEKGQARKTCKAGALPGYSGGTCRAWSAAQTFPRIKWLEKKEQNWFTIPHFGTFPEYWGYLNCTGVVSHEGRIAAASWESGHREGEKNKKHLEVQTVMQAKLKNNHRGKRCVRSTKGTSSNYSLV